MGLLFLRSTEHSTGNKTVPEKWLQHIQRMDTNRIPRQALRYRPEGRRNVRRQKKRWRIKKQEKRLTLNEHDDDDDDRVKLHYCFNIPNIAHSKTLQSVLSKMP
jgi:hypothetical protein